MSRQSTVKLAFSVSLIRLYLWRIKRLHLVPKCPLPLTADVVLNQLQIEAALERHQALSEVDDDAPHRPDADPLSNPQSRRRAVNVA